jgi:hypothetical protein
VTRAILQHGTDLCSPQAFPSASLCLPLDLLTLERPDVWVFKVAIRRLRGAEAQIKERSWQKDLASADRETSATTDESAETRLYLEAASGTCRVAKLRLLACAS